MSKKTTSPKDRKGVNPQRRPAKTPAESPAEPETPKKEEAPAPASSPTTEPPATTDQPDAKVDRPSQEVLSRLVKHWQQALARFVKAQAYLKGRGLWVRELLVALCIGYSSGKLPQMLPRDGKIRRQLIRMGILNQKANEFFYKRLVIPIVDENGVLVNVYGRAIDPEAETPHLYLPGPHRGVFNLAGIREAPMVIVTEALLDAVSLLVLGFLNTTSSYGANGFTADHKAALLRAKTTRVYCAYDADPAGDHAADQLAHDLAGHGIEVLRVQLPCKDPNDFLKGGGTREQFQALLDQAVVIPVAGTSSSAGIDETTVPSPAVTQGFEIQLGDRTYTIGAPPLSGFTSTR
ncbi:MAG: toprim domain-containing protein [Candidatus Wallbacteria bacterium]|nr:toprim domain-containing protein [Candidatus Wallbacteria bacterium]